MSTETAPRCPEQIYAMEGDFNSCRGTSEHKGPHWSGTWRWTKPDASIDEADYEPHAQPEEWHLDSAQPATMAALRGLNHQLTAIVLDVRQTDRDVHEFKRDVYRPIIGLGLGINRLLEHLGAQPITDDDIDAALGITPDPEGENEDPF
jgi:hypothetical protein